MDVLILFAVLMVPPIVERWRDRNAARRELNVFKNRARFVGAVGKLEATKVR